MSSSIDRPWVPDPDSDQAYALFGKEHRVSADDGTPIAYTVRNPNGDRVPLIFASGWSCSDAYWAGILPALQERGHPCILPDTRGHGLSGLPRDPGRGARNLTVHDVSMSRLGRDMVSVLDASGFDRAVVIGHSMGVQTGLEVYRQIPDRVAGLVLVAGTFENPASTFYGLPILNYSVPVFRTLMRWVPEVVKPIQASIGPPSVGHFGARMARAAGPKSTAEGLLPYLLHIKAVDMPVMTLMAAAMRDHSAADLLPRITAPTLVISAGSDRFTPARCSEVMHHRIEGSEMVTFPDGHHTLPIEEPEAIARAIDDFTTRRVADA